MHSIKHKLQQLWRAVRQLSGDDAYERYLVHFTEQHPADTPLSREQFFRQWQDDKWQGVKRCC